MARFITFEGIEGSGKSTQVSRVAAHFKTEGYKVLISREPGGTPLGNGVRDLLLRARDEAIEPLAELFLMQGARAQHVHQVLKPASTRFDFIFCDRFTDSTLAYQGGGRGIDTPTIQRLNHLASAGIVPDLTVLLDGSVATHIGRALQRLSSSHSNPEDRFERESRSFHERVRSMYLALAKNDASRFLVVDASADPDRITSRIVQEIASRFVRPK